MDCSDKMLAAWRGEHLPQLTDEMLSDVNHYTLFLSDQGASVTADKIRASVPALT